MSLKLFDTRRKDLVQLDTEGSVDLYVCGPTTYSPPHIGHARSYVLFDTLAKHLKQKGVMVRYVQNITDMGKNIKNKADELISSPQEVVDVFERDYFEAMEILNVDSVDVYERSSVNIDLAIDQIDRILRNGHAYINPEGVFFDTTQFDFGSLSQAHPVRQTLQKHNPLDFALWDYDLSWGVVFQSRYGPGKPHWHVQDTAIAERHFGNTTYNIHGAGTDCIYPHHESIRAILKSLSGEQEPVDIWMHNGLINVNGEKMSKSSNNSIALKSLLGRYSPTVIRAALLSLNYQSPVEFDMIPLSELESKVDELCEIARKLPKTEQTTNCYGVFDHYNERFGRALDNNLDTCSAFDVFVSFANEVRERIAARTLTNESAKKACSLFRQFDYVLGLGIMDGETKNG